MEDVLARVNDQVSAERKYLMSTLSDFISIRSVSARMEGLTESVAYLEKLLEEHGFTVSVLDTKTGRPA
ncbi:MAG: hypothetical protein QXT91_06735, partial [Candidatus Caldarchaeum sp.]